MPTKEITIAGQTFAVSTPYTEGHPLTAGEAKALNQVRCENIRNNLAKLVKNEDQSLSADEIAAKVAEYDSTYDFTISVGGGGRVVDPLERECLSIAKGVVKKKIAEKGQTVKAYTSTEEGLAAYNAALETVMANEKVIKIAKDNLKKKAEAAAAASADLGI